MKPENHQYVFTNNWFNGAARSVWETLIPQISPSRILEIGSYEGASTCFLIELLGQIHATEIHCVDTWDGGIEHQSFGVEMKSVEARFHHNVAVATQKAPHQVTLTIHKGYSDQQLATLLSTEKRAYFDFIYVDGSHQAPDVLADAVMSFRLLRVGGVMVLDDYLWEDPSGTQNILRNPKIAIDAFTTIYSSKLRILAAPLYQVYIQKLAD